VSNFLTLYGGDTMQYLYPAPGLQWNLSTEDVRQVLKQHRAMALLLQLDKTQHAVQRAQELADQYETDGITGRDIEQLFAMFRAAR